MRKVPNVDDDPTVATADWKASVESVLDEVDQQLADHGLEVAVLDTGSDEYRWRIERRSPSPTLPPYEA